ncbi:MAG: FeoB-associated Cys-rich membrane protein [Clostridiales bacterium]|nr:FeoB-associated Cys-rich membrane protein [Clostridiales bacterium]
MGFWAWIIFAAVAAAFALALYRTVVNMRRSKGCPGNCAYCHLSAQCAKQEPEDDA